ncbi:MAG TPA: sulfate adenylyltransferase subunit CysD [Pseudonocardiaceae bacterium]|nr:sulfate adenylyltransferase subunit CysD [Pseudonocardiaceae bacterium]
MTPRLTDPRGLIDETVHIIRETAGQFTRPALMFSGGKDSMVMLDVARRAFWPSAIPFPLLHVDTGQNFPEVIEFRDRMVGAYGVDLIVASVQDTLTGGRAEQNGDSRNRVQAVTLREAIAANQFDAVLGGARRDEEKARAKERVFSIRDEFGRWDPRNQRPELWDLYNGRLRPREHVRVFPISDWTELDVWTYIAALDLDVPSLYFAHERPVFERAGMLLAVTDFTPPRDGDRVYTESVRYRTIGDTTCTAAIRSTARTPHDVITETAATRVSERAATRIDDRISDFAMEDRKREGYF